MDPHPTSFPGNKSQSVKSKYKNISDPMKQKTKEVPKQIQRRTFGTVWNPNVPEKAIPDNPKSKPLNKTSLKQPKPEPIPKLESARKTPQNESIERAKLKNKKKVSFPKKVEGSVTKKSPAREVDGVKTPVRQPFSIKTVRIPGTPYLSAEKCSSCQFDRLETAAYWLGQIKSAETVTKHFVSATFFRLAHDCKAEPVRNIQIELKKYLARHEYLSTKTEWEDVSRLYGILKKERETKSNEENTNLFYEETDTHKGGRSKVEDIIHDHEQGIKKENDGVKDIYEQET